MKNLVYFQAYKKSCPHKSQTEQFENFWNFFFPFWKKKSAPIPIPKLDVFRFPIPKPGFGCTVAAAHGSKGNFLNYASTKKMKKVRKNKNKSRFFWVKIGYSSVFILKERP